nr:uncharacterized protein LOC109152706 [Ipomoea trifida]
MVSTWITRSVSPEIAQTVLWVGTAEKIWNTLKARFSEADIFRISDLHAEIHQIRQGDLTVSAYFAKLKVLWDELQVIRPLPECKCERRCDCGLLNTLQQHLESDNLSVFLRGLNDGYASVQSQIMMTKPLPTVDEAFMMVQQQERRLNNGVIGLQLPAGQVQEAGSILFTQGTASDDRSPATSRRFRSFRRSLWMSLVVEALASQMETMISSAAAQTGAGHPVGGSSQVAVTEGKGSVWSPQPIP